MTNSGTRVSPSGIHCPECGAAPGFPCTNMVHTPGVGFQTFTVSMHRRRLIAAYRMSNPRSAESGWR